MAKTTRKPMTEEDMATMKEHVQLLSKILNTPYEKRMRMLLKNPALSSLYCLTEGTIAMMMVDYYKALAKDWHRLARKAGEIAKTT